MCLTLRLKPIAALCCVSLVSPVALAGTQVLDKITITSATKTERTLDQMPVSVEVIDEQAIKAIGAATFADILRHSEGVFMNPDQRAMSMRGVGAKGVLLLIDGRRVASEFTKNYDAGRIPVASIERVEIIKGPMAALYGSDALGGVINIITKNPQDGTESSITVSGGTSHKGEVGQVQVEADVRGRSGATGYSAWFSAQKRETYTESETATVRVGQAGEPRRPSELTGPDASSFGQLRNNLDDQYTVDTSYRDPAEVISVGAKLTHQLNEQVELNGRLSLMQETRESTGIANVYESNFTNPSNGQNIRVQNVPFQQSLNNERVEVGVGANIALSEQLQLEWQSDLSYYKKQDEITSLLWQELGYASQSDSAGLTGDGKVYIQQHSVNTTWTPTESHRLLAGLEYFEDKRDAAFFEASGKMTTKTLDTKSAFAQYEWQVSEPWAIIAGVRYDDTSSSGDATTANLGTVYQLNPMANLRARYAQGFRAPDSQEMSINRFNPQGRRFVGASVVDSSINKQAFDLNAEKSENIELGLSGRNPTWWYDLAVYQTNITDNILRDNTADYISFRNAKQVDIQGLDTRFGWRVSSDLNLDLAINLLDSKDKETNKRLEYTPDLTARLSANYQMTPSLKTRMAIQHVGDQRYSTTAQGQTTYQNADAYTFVNVNLNYVPTQWQQAEVFGGVNNLFNTQVDKVLGSDPGPFVHAGVRVYF